MPRRENRERANSEGARGKAPAEPRSRDSKRPPRLDATHVAGITSLMNTTNMSQGLNLDSAEQDVMGRDPPQNARKHAARDPVELFTKELEELSRDLGIELNDEGFGGGPPSPSAESEPEKNTARPRVPTSSSRGPASSAQIGALIEDLGLGGGGGSGHKTRTPDADKGRGHRRSSGRRSVATSSEESSERGSASGSAGARWGSGSSSASRRRHHKHGRKGRKSRETADESVDRVLAKFEK